MSTEFSVIQAIQLILAPAVMISACGLLLLGISNKFSAVLNRIRLLNDEKRRLHHRSGDSSPPPRDQMRLENLSQQIDRLMTRARLIQSSLLCYIFAVALFVLTSLIIGADFFLGTVPFGNVTIVTFLVGMILVFLGVLYAAFDTRMGYTAVTLEVEEEKQKD
ncbi:MAG: DUF2721 domain-containing protein [Ignavibacteria bacterium]|nr:DUF2721 domain-containing protein [Ignavibacteria bacterium]